MSQKTKDWLAQNWVAMVCAALLTVLAWIGNKQDQRLGKFEDKLDRFYERLIADRESINARLTSEHHRINTVEADLSRLTRNVIEGNKQRTGNP